MASQSSPSGSTTESDNPLDRLKYYRSEIRHEFDLISARLSSYLTAQSFLVLAYAAAMNNTNPKSQDLFPLAFSSLISVIAILYQSKPILASVVRTSLFVCGTES